MAADPTRIAVVNPVKVVADMQERKDLQQKIDNNLKLYDGMLREKKEKAGQLKAALDALKPGTPQYDEKKQQFIQADIELAVWAKSTQTSMDQDRKVQMRGLFDRVEAAVGEIAKQKGYDLVIANQADDLPEDLDRMNIDQLRRPQFAQRSLILPTRSTSPPTSWRPSMPSTVPRPPPSNKEPPVPCRPPHPAEP